MLPHYTALRPPPPVVCSSAIREGVGEVGEASCFYDHNFVIDRSDLLLRWLTEVHGRALLRNATIFYMEFLGVRATSSNSDNCVGKCSRRTG